MTTTTKTAHTPGPWEASGSEAQYEISARGVTLARAYGYQESSDEPKCNARLIAAAPDLLEALVELHGWMLNHLGPADGVHDLLCRSHTAIAKATT